MRSDHDTANVEPSEGSRMLAGIRAMLVTALMVAGSLVVAVSVTEGTWALWVQQSTITPGTIQTGSADLDVDAAFTTASWSNMLVGESVRQSFTIANTGDVALDLAASGTSSGGLFELRAVRGSCPSSALTGTSITATPTSLGTLGAGATTTACLEVRLGAGAAPGATSTVQVTVTGTQVG